ncbi:MAG: leucine-rich repeat domain-containing protein, partial [Muribaculaceae bacterium]|nr:leucine-rich repeat domain-containing protein [Muribaculaceae bacterium]
MKLKYLLASLIISCTSAANAIDITTVTAGSLESQLGDNKAITTLKVTGPINAADFEYITGTLTSLTSIDLSGATIEAVSGLKTPTGNTEFAANELPHYALFGTKASAVVLPDNIVSIGEGALGNSSITSIKIPASVTTINDYAFAGCTDLTEITVPSTVTALGAGIFKGCTALENATIYARVDEIGANMFDGCASLSNLLLQPTYKSLGNNALTNCSKLAEFNFPSTLVSIGDKAFYNSGLTAVNLGNSTALASIGDFAFAQCRNLEIVNIGDTTPALGKGIFFDDTALVQVQLPSSTTVIPAFTFKGTNSIDADNVLPASTQKIEDYALCGWDHAQSLVLPEGTSYLGSGAMEGWTSLQKIDAEHVAEVPALGNEVWAGVDQSGVYLYVKDDLASDFRDADQWKEFKVTIGASGADNIIDDVTGENGAADVDFNVGDGFIRIQSHGTEIADIRIYDLNGRNRYAASVDNSSVTVNTSQWRGSVLIVDVTLTG